MRKFFSNVKDRIRDGFTSEAEDMVEGEEEYVELDTDSSSGDHRRTKILVRSFVIEDFSDVKQVIDSLRDGYTIALINIKPLKNKDVVELKRAVNKIKKTCDAISGDLAGFGEDWIVSTPGFAEIYRSQKAAGPSHEGSRRTEMVDENEERNKTVLEQYDTDDVF